MILFFELVVVFLVYAVARRNNGAAFDYCKVDCGKDVHTMCLWPSNKVDFSEDCKRSKVRTGILADLKRAILYEINAARQKVASGEQPGQPQASNMMKIRWNNEAAMIAQRWVNQCQYGHDKCNKMSDGTPVAQYGLVGGVPQNRTDLASTMVNTWFKEVDDFTDTQIDKYDILSDVHWAKYLHYSQLVWANTTGVGCGSLEQIRADNSTKVGIGCNFVPGGNIQDMPTYLRGEPCTRCPDGGSCSQKYPALCLGTDDDDKDDNIEDDKIINTSRKGSDAEKPIPGLGVPGDEDTRPTEASIYIINKVASHGKSKIKGSAFSSKPSMFTAVSIVMIVLLLWF